MGVVGGKRSLRHIRGCCQVSILGTRTLKKKEDFSSQKKGQFLVKLAREEGVFEFIEVICG